MTKFTLRGEYISPDELQASEINSILSTKVTHEFVAETLDEVLPQIQDFLRGLGYQPEGNLEFVEDFTAEESDKTIHYTLSGEVPGGWKPGLGPADYIPDWDRYMNPPVHAKDIKKTGPLKWYHYSDSGSTPLTTTKGNSE